MNMIAKFHREYIYNLDPHEAIEYLINVIEGRSREDIERYARIRDAIPAAGKHGIIVLDLLWRARPRVQTYEALSQELEYQSDAYPTRNTFCSVVKRLRAAIRQTKHPIEIIGHYGIGYSLKVPDGWEAPWEEPL